MKILLIGKNGQVGWELQRTLAPLGQVMALGRSQLDLTDAAAVRQTVRSIAPQLIVNAAAYTAVDQAEAEPELAIAINGVAPGILAAEAGRSGSVFIHYSTDYVFDGAKQSPYQESDRPDPLNVYGQTKLAGEQAIQAVGGHYYILRTSWVYGLRGKNFLLTILRLAQERDTLRVVNDQLGAPTWSRLIAAATAQILAQTCAKRPALPLADPAPPGIYHLTAAGVTSWHEFAQTILECRAACHPELTALKLNPSQIQAIPTSEYPTPAQRPRYSVLDNRKISQEFGLQLPPWRVQLELAVRDCVHYPTLIAKQ